MIHEEQSYGHFLGGDPRKFDPDPECSTEEERERHRVACAKAEECPGDVCGFMQMLGVPAGPGFGLGVTTFEVACEGVDCPYCA